MSKHAAPEDAAERRIAELEAQLAELRAGGATATAVAEPEPEPEPPRHTMTLQELRKYDGTLYVKHNDPVRQFSCHQRLGDNVTGMDRRVDFDLGPAGSPESICILPKLALEIRGVQRAWKRGTISISKDEDMENEIDLLMNQHLQMASDQIAALQAPLQESNAQKDIITKPCLECGKYGRDETGAPTMGIIGGQSFMRYADYMAGNPPLCQNHAHLTNLYVGTLVTDPATGIQEWKFTKSAVGQTVEGLPSQQEDRRTAIQRIGQAPSY